MPVIVDPTKEIAKPGETLDDGISIDVAGQDSIVMTKFVTTNPQKATLQPEGEWFQQVTVDVGGGRKSVRIGIEGPNGETRGVNIDDGLIIDLIGTMSGLVGLVPGYPPMDEDAVNAYIDQTDERVPMFQKWDFRVAAVKKTNGPEERVKMHRSEDQKRLNAQTEMFQAFSKMFSMGSQAGMISPDGVSMLSPQETLTAGVEVASQQQESETRMFPHLADDTANQAVDEGITTE